MAITTIDNLITAYPGQLINFYRNATTSKAAGTWQSMWPSVALTASPGPGVVPTAATLWAQRTSGQSGTLPFTNPSSGSSYLARLSIDSSIQALFVLYDRLCHVGTITPAASTQTLTTAALPSRPDALGADVELWLEWTSASGATPSDLTCSYTNQAGVAGQTTQVLAGQTSSVVGQMQQFSLQAGDTGVRTVESFTGTGALGGTCMLVLLRRIADSSTANMTTNADPFTTGMPQIYNSAALTFMWSSLAATTLFMHGSLQVVQG